MYMCVIMYVHLRTKSIVQTMYCSPDNLHNKSVAMKGFLPSSFRREKIRQFLRFSNRTNYEIKLMLFLGRIHKIMKHCYQKYEQLLFIVGIANYNGMKHF